MLIKVKVIPRAKFNRIQELSEGNYKIHVSAPAQDNRANKAVEALAAEYFKVKKNQVSVIAGEKSHNKVIEIRG